MIYGGNSNGYTALLGQAGNDIYIVDKALLNSLSYVHILDNSTEENILHLKSVSADEIILKQSNTDIIITFNDSTATVHFGEEQLSSIVFDDGTVWDKAQIEQHIAEPVFGTNGNDVIEDNSTEENILHLKSVSADEIILKQSNTDIIITFNDSTATVHFGEEQLSSIVFDDGTVWDKAQIEQHIAEPVFGTNGNDVIETSIANQTYSYILGDGADTVVFNILDNTDNLGGNVKSEWTDFNLIENDKIDLSQLLINENGNLQDYISVKDTEAGLIISVDRDGSSQSTYYSQELILLTGKHDTLDNLIASNTFIH
ncbi:hypothetical protein BDGL_001270 [Acinetobacter pittii PHEA-2]|uniref:Type I secretion C-terminal target domain-containing protein n=1 Tax=Acinetobacter pittii (strain PHEA-2) TaxID=871585 RepID=F0KPT6_ACIP2|nr:type I secretion C-terminal target domain-containing protein [Acinetobacter pittii]YP_004995538.1 hypothetical protein BDGL_001270 [Acinetobacter pittii PHEA-2]ADY81856.1 hypothetical protein BDGL_001270 [Acinetobacter pittii PHEA-2]